VSDDANEDCQNREDDPMATVKHDDDQLHPAPGPSYNFTVKAHSNYPIQKVEYSVDMYDNTIFMVYQNAAYDLVAVVMAKLGQVMSEYEITGDVGRARAKIDEMGAAINSIEP
jgi:hypothetical protein